MAEPTDLAAIERAMLATLVKQARGGDSAAARKVLDHVRRSAAAQAPPAPEPEKKQRKAKPKTSASLADLPRDEWLRAQLIAAQDIVDAARADASHQAAANALRTCLKVREELDAVLRERQATVAAEEAMTEEDLVTTILEAVQALPDHLFDLVAESVYQRRAPGLRVVQGGEE